MTPAWQPAPIATQQPLPNPAAAVAGAWGPVVSWPVIPIHASLLPDGRVMTFGTRTNGTQTAMFEYDVWSSLEGTGPESHLTLPNGTQTDVFCSSQLVLPLSGDVILKGGDIYDPARGSSTNVATADATLFRSASNTLERAGTMKRPRWYGSAITLPNGETYIQGGTGGNDRAEIRDLDGNFRLLTGFFTNDLDYYYPRVFSAPDGTVFGFSGRALYRIDPTGDGGRPAIGNQSRVVPNYMTPAVMFSPGQILVVGNDTRSAVVDIRGPSWVVTSAGALSTKRLWSNATVLADGKVAVSGGSGVANVMTDVAYHVELFDPATRTWASGPSAQRARLYHSVSLLLPDATMLTGGGRAPGPQPNLNAEIYYPPYLFDAAGQPKPRPTLSGAPTVVQPASTFAVRSPDAARITRLTLVATGSVTHSFDRNQRFLELPFYRDGEGLFAQLPTNAFDTPPGFYMLFAFDDAGTPSVARMIRINPR
ncbi:MAG: galactose oxidase-like domain-containing protein [Lautropia sp.]